MGIMESINIIRTIGTGEMVQTVESFPASVYDTPISYRAMATSPPPLQRKTVMDGTFEKTMCRARRQLVF